MFWALRERMTERRCSLPEDERLREQMAALQFDTDANGRVQVEPKDRYKARTGQSPDRLEAVVYANWQGVRAMTIGAY
jgi:hypothetical protein